MIFPLCIFPYNVGLYLILINVPSLACGSKRSEEHLMENSLSVSAVREAMNGIDCLETMKTLLSTTRLENELSYISL